MVVVGGDGTLHGVVNGLLHTGAQANELPLVGIVHVGTGGDFARALHVPHRLEDALQVLCTGHPLTVDAARVRCATSTGAVYTRYLINAASMGLGGEVAARVNGSPWLKRHLGSLVFAWAAVQAMAAGYRHRFELSVDGCVLEGDDYAIVAVCNGTHFGGGMRVAPAASPNDGVLDVVLVQAQSRRGLAQALARVYRGTHTSLPFVRSRRGARVTATPRTNRPVFIEIDGETLGTRLPIEIDIAPAALRFVTGHPAR